MDLLPDFDLSTRNTMGLPSRARLGAVIGERAALEALTREAQDRELPLHIIGGGSNLLLRDQVAGIVGVMATRGRTVDRQADGSVLVTAEAGEDWAEFVMWTVSQGLRGLENLALIPGTVGAAPVQNIGAYGVELDNRFHALTAWDTEEQRYRRFTRNECEFSYRQSLFKRTGGRFVVVDVTFALPAQWRPVLSYPPLDKLPADADAQTIMQTVIEVRRSKLPDWRLLGNAGSFFHNPVMAPAVADAIAGVPRYPQVDGSVKLSAAWLIEQAGLKGHREGRAGIYDKHALIVVNHGGATYSEVSALAKKVKDTVRERYGVALTQEPLEL